MLTSAVHGAVTGWNAVTLANTYNNRLQPTQYQAASPLSILLSLSYSYIQSGGGNNGSVVSITNGRDSSRSVSYTYDQVNRLSSAQTSSTWGDSYGYDAWGNLLTKNVIVGTAETMALTVNNKNQVFIPAFTYDAAGNVTWDTTHALNYDAEGHMTPVSGETYTYDGDGRRVLKSDGTVYWVDDQLRPISVGSTTGSITRDYIFLGSQRIAMVPISSGNPYYYLSDRLVSTAVVASGDGKTIQWEADYFPFGSVQQVFTNTVGNNYEFTGYESDSETGYNYANARYDAGRWGRFLSPDPYLGSVDVANPQSLNRYSYVFNNTLNLIDPSGLDPDPSDSPCDKPWDPCRVPDTQLLPLDPDGFSFDCSTLGLPCIVAYVVEKIGNNSDPMGGDSGGDFDGLLGRLPLFDVGDESGGGGRRLVLFSPQNYIQQTTCTGESLNPVPTKTLGRSTLTCEYSFSCKDGYTYIGGASYNSVLQSCGVKYANKCPNVLDTTANVAEWDSFFGLVRFRAMAGFKITGCH
jgi:RHS repeat-associated protein